MEYRDNDLEALFPLGVSLPAGRQVASGSIFVSIIMIYKN